MSYKRSTDDDDELALAEAELAKLQREYRQAEGQRKAYTEESQTQIRKQRGQLDKLIKDNELMLEEMRVVELEVGDSAKADQKSQELASKVQDQQVAIGDGKARVSELDLEIKKVQQEIKTKRAQVAKASRSANPTGLKSQIRTLENRLETATRKFNSALTGNKKLRETIESLKQERKVFDNMRKKLDRGLVDHKKRMADIIDQSNQAYEARDEAQHKLSALQEKSQRELAQFNAEIKELTRVLEHDRKLKSFMGVKGQDRSKGNAMSATRRKAALAGGQTEQAIQSYEAAFAKIKEATGIQDTEKLVERFIDVEDQNFALFNLVNEQNNELESLQEKISEVKSNIDKFNRQGEDMDRQRKKSMQELENRLQATDAKAADHESKLQEASGELDGLKKGVESLFNSVGCDKSLIVDMLGNASISNNNVMQFLGVIEQRTNELLQLQSLLDIRATQHWEKREAELRYQVDEGEDIDIAATLGPKPSVGSLLGVGPRPPSAAISIVPPSTEDDFESDDEFDETGAARPLTHAELRAKIMQKTSGAPKSRGASARSQR